LEEKPDLNEIPKNESSSFCSQIAEEEDIRTIPLTSQQARYHDENSLIRLSLPFKSITTFLQGVTTKDKQVRHSANVFDLKKPDFL